MKKFGLFLMMVVTLCVMSSCGSSKKTQSASSVYGTKIESSECQKLAEQHPERRAWGEAVNFRLSFAKTLAEGQARAEMARVLNSAIKTASEESGLDYSKGASNGEQGSYVNDEGSKANLNTSQIAEELVSNAVVIKTEQYQQSDKQYHVFVCLEYQDGVSKIVNKVKQQVSDEDRLKMDYQFQKFEEKVNEELERLRAAK
jgi:hypothetical protein